MKLDSKYFDCIRIKPEVESRAQPDEPLCQWSGCMAAGAHRAPMGRGRDGQYFRFCLDHVRQYNQSYNYFDGMSDAEVAAFQKDAVTGHRPTWRMGSNLSSQEREEQIRNYAEYLRSRRNGRGFRHGGIGGSGGFAADGMGTADTAPSRRPVRKLEQRALEALDLPSTASRSEIKLRFKSLVKRHHPDRNGGDKASEEKLREVIQAYNYLKQAGLV